MKGLVFDIEIAKCILGRNEQPDSRYKYCNGWDDHAGMGVSCICTLDTRDVIPKVYLAQDIELFIAEVRDADFLIGFNSVRFDSTVLGATYPGLGDLLGPKKHYDILQKVWVGAGLDPWTFNWRTHGGFGLNDLCMQNLGIGKTGDGANAPKLFQEGRLAELINYNLQDVWLTHELYKHIELTGELLTKQGVLQVERPSKVFNLDALDAA